MSILPAPTTVHGHPRSKGPKPYPGGALARLGVQKAHWECWAKCSLSCSFCYRAKDEPLDTAHAIRLIEILTQGGISELVFAGGDPSLRRDLGKLLAKSHEVGLQTEVQTNSQVRTAEFRNALAAADLVGLSLDASNEDAHDSFRARRGNFSRVLELASVLEDRQQPFVVRTVVSQANLDAIGDLGPLIEHFSFLRRWSLVQFTPIGDGYTNRSDYEIDDQKFLDSAWGAAEKYLGPAEVNVYPNSRKSGIYFIVGPSGDVHGEVDGGALETYPTVGNLLRDSLDEIAERINFNPSAHAGRYKGLITPSEDERDLQSL